jgi:collagen type IV alpha
MRLQRGRRGGGAPARARRADAARAQAAAMAAASAAHCAAELLADVAALSISLLAAARDDAPQPLINAVGPPRLRGAGPPDGFGVPGQMEGLQFGPTGVTVLPGPVAPPGAGFAPALALAAANGPAPGVRGGGGAGGPAAAPPLAPPAPPGPAPQARPAGVQHSAPVRSDALRRACVVW